MVQNKAIYVWWILFILPQIGIGILKDLHHLFRFYSDLPLFGLVFCRYPILTHSIYSISTVFTDKLTGPITGPISQIGGWTEGLVPTWCPHESVLAIKSGSSANFCMAYRNSYSWEHIKNQELAGVNTAIKFLHGRVLQNFQNGIFEVLDFQRRLKTRPKAPTRYYKVL